MAYRPESSPKSGHSFCSRDFCATHRVRERRQSSSGTVRAAGEGIKLTRGHGSRTLAPDSSAAYRKRPAFLGWSRTGNTLRDCLCSLHRHERSDTTSTRQPCLCQLASAGLYDIPGASDESHFWSCSGLESVADKCARVPQTVEHWNLAWHNEPKDKPGTRNHRDGALNDRAGGGGFTD